jgi:hypothetical protein
MGAECLCLQDEDEKLDEVGYTSSRKKMCPPLNDFLHRCYTHDVSWMIQQIKSGRLRLHLFGGPTRLAHDEYCHD